MSSPGWEALQRATAERRRQLADLEATAERLEGEAKAAERREELAEKQIVLLTVGMVLTAIVVVVSMKFG
ncbi:hypothetical protein D5S17_10590 [Pseudonocardiaceae bacterium YIM PH 21723]|nr:hypothetical protein D5S17_10590 [Pseudonocardiaceae bacterium YIM PH 21723]